MSSRYNTVILAICVSTLLFVSYLLSLKEGFEINIPHAGGRQAEKPPNFMATFSNTPTGYTVDTKGKFDDMDITMIYLHKPSDEPMLKYYIKEKTPVQSKPLPPGETAEVYLMQTVGRCWRSTVPIVLPKEGDAPIQMEMTVADCI